MPKKTALMAFIAVCMTAVVLTALFQGSLCELHYKSTHNDLHIRFAYEVS